MQGDPVRDQKTIYTTISSWLAYRHIESVGTRTERQHLLYLVAEDVRESTKTLGVVSIGRLGAVVKEAAVCVGGVNQRRSQGCLRGPGVTKKTRIAPVCPPRSW
jgi:hypothetical protein